MNGERIAMRLYGSQAGWYYFVNDHLGTPWKVVDSSGVVVWQAAYLPFGKAQVLSGSSITNNFRFPGQYYDAETELHQNWNRYYMPAKGRYLTPDHIGLAGGINLYAYVTGNPINRIDPEGRIPIDTVWDALNIIYDVATGDWASLAADTTAFFIPYVPAGITKVSKGIDAATDAAKAAKKAKSVGGGSCEAASEASKRTLNDPLPANPKKPTQANPHAPDPDAQGPHSVIGTRTDPKKSPEPYRQGITYNANGNPVGRTDVTSHGRGDHTNPHWHPYDPNMPNRFDPDNPGNFGPAQPMPD